MIAEEILKGAINGISFCENGGTLDDFLDNLRENDINENTYRKSISSILFTYYRKKATIDYIIKTFASKKIEPVLRRILSVVLTQIFFQSGIPGEIAVSIAVDYAKKIKGPRPAGFINAIARRATGSTINTLIQKAPKHVKLNLPEFLLKNWKKSFNNTELKQIFDALNKKAEFTFRVIKHIPEIELRAAGCKKINNLNFNIDDIFYYTEFPGKVLEEDWLKNGQIYIQDPATAVSTRLVKLTLNSKILDICSAPGGKTIMLAEKNPSSIIFAMDRSHRRQKRLIENLSRIKHNNIIIYTGDATSPPFKNDTFDCVLADVPCSNTGVIRKRPDVMWRISHKSLSDISLIQQKILCSAAKLVKPGGRLIYSTCSIEQIENDGQVEKFLKTNKEFYRKSATLLLPSAQNDGAYAAELIKK